MSVNVLSVVRCLSLCAWCQLLCLVLSLHSHYVLTFLCLPPCITTCLVLSLSSFCLSLFVVWFCVCHRAGQCLEWPQGRTLAVGVCVCAVVMFGCVIGLFYCRVCHLIHQALASQPSKGHDTFDVYSKI